MYSQVTYSAVNDRSTLNSKETADYTAYAADLMFEYPFDIGTLTVSSQYLKADFEDAYKTNSNPADRNTIVAGINGQKEGWYAKLAYLLPVTIGKEGKLQPYVLHENWKFTHLLGVNDQTVTTTGVGINYYIHKQNVKTTLEYLAPAKRFLVQSFPDFAERLILYIEKHRQRLEEEIDTVRKFIFLLHCHWHSPSCR